MLNSSLFRSYYVAIAFLCVLGPWARAEEAQTSGCDCSAIAQSCGTSSVDSLKHIGRRHPNCTLAELSACGARYQLQFDTNKLRRAQNPEAKEFIKALQDNADEMITLYSAFKVTPREYTEMAALAIGILGKESGFYLSPRYLFKKMAPDWVIDEIKCRRYNICRKGNGTDVKDLNSERSQGPTQLKIIRERVANYYGITPESVWKNPTHAALATMAFLIELKRELYNYKRVYPTSMAGYGPDTYLNYLPYFYQAKGKRVLIRGEMPNPADSSRMNYLYAVHSIMDDLKIVEYICPAQSSPVEDSTTVR